MFDPRILSIDIETFGKLIGYPHQTCFTPRRCIFIDGVKPSDLCLCAGVTLPTFDPRPDPSTPWSAPLIAQLKPGPTFIFDLRNRAHIHMLFRWLLYADTLLGMNLQFDLIFLRYFSALLRSALTPFRHLILDLGYINYLECEMRPERSLKPLGPVLGTHVYAESDLFEKLPTWSSLTHYQAQDPHNTMLAAAVLASRIARSPSPDKLSPFCIQFYSDSIWSLLLMTENGVPISTSRAHSLLTTLTATMQECEALASFNHDLLLSGKGSDKSLAAFFARILMVLGDTIDYSRLILTEKRGAVSTNEANRSYLASLLPPSHPYLDGLSLISRHTRAEKLIGSYLFPMLLHKKQRKNGRLNRSALLIPQPGVPHPCPLTPPPEPAPSPLPGSNGSSVSTPKASSSPKKRSKKTPSPSKSSRKKANASPSKGDTSTDSSATASAPTSSSSSSSSAARLTPKPPEMSSSPVTPTTCDPSTPALPF